MLVNILDVVRIFLTTVDGLMNTRLSGDRIIYVETKDGRHINFRPNSFKKKLQDVVGEKADIKELMRYFRSLRWIVTNTEGKFSNIQRIQSRVMRVITVDGEVLEVLRELYDKKRNVS